jgi:hypothetical protein
MKQKTFTSRRYSQALRQESKVFWFFFSKKNAFFLGLGSTPPFNTPTLSISKAKV